MLDLKKHPTQELIDKAFMILADNILLAKKTPYKFNDIEREASRIERCVEHHYKIDKKVLFSYQEYASNFILKNYKEFLFGTKYNEQYFGDLPDGVEKETYIEEFSILMG